jgi:hypothetical protein
VNTKNQEPQRDSNTKHKIETKDSEYAKRDGDHKTNPSSNIDLEKSRKESSREDSDKFDKR